MKSEKNIIVIPSAGLGNRMRVLSSCVELAKVNNRKLYVVWPKNAALGCQIEDVLQGIGMEYHTLPGWAHRMVSLLFRHGAVKRFHPLYRLLARVLSIQPIFDDDIIKKRQLKLETTTKSILVATCFAFVPKPTFRNFRFTDELVSRAQSVFSQFGTCYVGVHLRRTDHTDIVTQSPVIKYTELMDKMIGKNHDQKFFVATDDPETKMYLKSRYKGCVFTFESKLGRGSLGEIQDGVVELLLLSKSTGIICSNLSSYSDTAISIGNIKQVWHV